MVLGDRRSHEAGVCEPEQRPHRGGLELVPGERLVMSTADGPFPMETTYTWTDAGAGRTRMTLRNRGKPSGFAKLAGLVMSPAIRRANRKDLARLKQVLEVRAGRTGSPRLK